MVWHRRGVLWFWVKERGMAWVNLYRSASGNDFRAFQLDWGCMDRWWDIYVIRWGQRLARVNELANAE